uniref:Uncharacterized protein n=1 Tax=Cacopsylla melanoneura TaxID=428564 RepID=A0A8D8W3X5_9HEMI
MRSLDSCLLLLELIRSVFTLYIFLQLLCVPLIFRKLMMLLILYNLVLWFLLMYLSKCCGLANLYSYSCSFSIIFDVLCSIRCVVSHSPFLYILFRRRSQDERLLCLVIQ